MAPAFTPPPPPRRTGPVPAGREARSPSMWERAKSGGSSAWNGLYGVADTVGAWSNTQSSKLGLESFYPASMELESQKAARILRTFTMDAADLPEEALADRRKTQKVLKKIPQSLINSCKGLAIFTVFRTGFVLSGAGGSGIVIARLADGSWSPPSGILLHTAGFGLMFGADVYDVVLILRTQKAVDSFSNPRVTVGGEVSVAAANYGSGMMLEMGIEASPVISFTKSKGLYGGIQIDGNIVIERVDENARAYSRPGIKAKQILKGEVSAPYWCEGLHQTIFAAEGKPFRIAAIPLGPSASELEVPASLFGSTTPRRLPPEPQDDADILARQEMEAALLEFGIEDPKVNDTAREEDALMLQGEALNTPTYDESGTPALSLAGSPGMSTPNSSIYPLSLEEGTGLGFGDEVETKPTGPPPKLPARRAVPPIPMTPVSAPSTPEHPAPAEFVEEGHSGTEAVEVDATDVEAVEAKAIEVETVEVEAVEGETATVESAEEGEGVQERTVEGEEEEVETPVAHAVEVMESEQHEKAEGVEVEAAAAEHEVKIEGEAPSSPAAETVSHE